MKYRDQQQQGLRAATPWVTLLIMVCGGYVCAQSSLFLNTEGQDWNNPANWSDGEPSGLINASIGASQTAVASGGTADAYTGTLELGSNAILRVAQATDAAALGGGVITFNAGSGLILLSNAQYSFGSHPLSLNGNATLSSDAFTIYRLYGGVTGTGTLTVTGGSFWLQNNNSLWSGGVVVGAGASIRTYAGGSLGSGNVSAVGNSTIEINRANVIDDNATVTLSGTPRSAGGSKLLASSPDTIGTLEIAATNSIKLISGSSILSVNDHIAVALEAGARATIEVPLAGAGGLTMTGGGTLVFTSHPSYSGPTQIEGGSVEILAAYVRSSSYLSLDALNASFTAGFGGDFADLGAVVAEAGNARFFRAGRPGIAVSARDNGDGTFTITAGPPGGMVFIVR